MAVSVYKTFAAGEILTASDLNASFHQIVDNGEDLGFPATQALDLNGFELILDANADTSITADTDNQIDFRLGGSDLFRMLVTSTMGELRIIGNDAGASDGPLLVFDRDSATPAANDYLGEIIFRGNDSAANNTDYAAIASQIATATDGSEAARLYLRTLVGGSISDVLQIGSGATATLNSTDAGASGEPTFTLYRNSASPAASDVIGLLHFDGNDSGGNQTSYVSLQSSIVDTTNGSEDGKLSIGTQVAGTLTSIATFDSTGLNVASGNLQKAGDVYPLVYPLSSVGTGTTFDVLSIPSWATQITVMLKDVSTNGTSSLALQLGDSGGIETSGYAATVGNILNNTHDIETTMFPLTQVQVAAGSYSGQVTLNLMDSATHTWVSSGIISRTDSGATHCSSGYKATSAVLDRVRLRAINGTDSFDAGSISVRIS